MTNDYSIELSPCPLCGEEPIISPEGEFVEIRCDDCQLSMWNYSYEMVIKMWERRA